MKYRNKPPTCTLHILVVILLFKLIAFDLDEGIYPVARVWNFVQTGKGFLPEIVVVVSRSGGHSAGFFASYLAAPRCGLLFLLAQG